MRSLYSSILQCYRETIFVFAPFFLWGINFEMIWCECVWVCSPIRFIMARFLFGRRRHSCCCTLFPLSLCLFTLLFSWVTFSSFCMVSICASTRGHSSIPRSAVLLVFPFLHWCEHMALGDWRFPRLLFLPVTRMRIMTAGRGARGQVRGRLRASWCGDYLLLSVLRYCCIHTIGKQRVITALVIMSMLPKEKKQPHDRMHLHLHVNASKDKQMNLGNYDFGCILAGSHDSLTLSFDLLSTSQRVEGGEHTQLAYLVFSLKHSEWIKSLIAHIHDRKSVQLHIFFNNDVRLWPAQPTITTPCL